MLNAAPATPIPVNDGNTPASGEPARPSSISPATRSSTSARRANPRGPAPRASKNTTFASAGSCSKVAQQRNERPTDTLLPTHPPPPTPVQRQRRALRPHGRRPPENSLRCRRTGHRKSSSTSPHAPTPASRSTASTLPPRQPRAPRPTAASAAPATDTPRHPADPAHHAAPAHANPHQEAATSSALTPAQQGERRGLGSTGPRRSGTSGATTPARGNRARDGASSNARQLAELARSVTLEETSLNRAPAIVVLKGGAAASGKTAAHRACSTGAWE